MKSDYLRDQLRGLQRRQLWLGLGWKIAACWALAAVAGVLLIWLQGELAWSSALIVPILAGLAATLVTAVAMHHYQKSPDARAMAQRVEQAFPELKGVLLTAVQQDVPAGREPNFLQQRVLEEAASHGERHDWRRIVPGSQLVLAHGAQFAALVCFALVLANVRQAPRANFGTAWASVDGIEVSPGDTKLEKGETLVVLARFGKKLPATVNLIVKSSGNAARTTPLVKSLADPVFGGSVPEVDGDLTYQLAYGAARTREFKVSVFEHPKLVRSDADLTFPDYTKLPPKHLADSRRIGAVEGTKLDLTLQLNKPVAAAKLVARNKEKTVIPLTVDPAQPVAKLPAFALTTSQAYDLQLIDAEGRANKTTAPIFIDVQPNRRPELKLASPRGDLQPSALEEIVFDGTVFDDFGVPAYGLTYSIAGRDAKDVPLGVGTAAKEKRSFSHTLKLEELGAKPDDLVSWFVWADDIGPDGAVRRTNSDMYFGEIRPFDQIFRESQQGQEEQQGGGGGGGNQARKLTELQKQIINATWKLQREGRTSKYAEDEKVVRDSQQDALEQAQEALGNAGNPRAQAMWQAAAEQMVTALDHLKDAMKGPEPLPKALAAEQAAYQALLKLQARETQVTRRNRNQRGGGGGGGGQNQRQLDQLDLTQEENRYETQRQARAQPNQQRQEQLQVMNRLQELARRQQDLNERLKELQTALQEARTEEEREEARRRLKRLEEEQRQMVADMDEVRQRMDRQENQSQMANQRQQIEQARDDAQRAADAAAQGSAAQALAAGTRAQRQVQQARDELRKESSNQFADDMRDMRNEARDLAQKQDEINQQLEQLGNTQRRSLSDSVDRKDLLDQLTQQKERENKLLDHATQVSQQSESSEPLLSRQLEEAVRKLSQDDSGAVKQTREDMLRDGQMTRDLADRLRQTLDRDGGGKVIEMAGELLKEGQNSQARQAGQRARAGIEELRRGVERAAESVLGDDTEQLKLAQSELDKLTQQLQRELAQAQGENREGQPGQQGQSGQPGENREGARTAQRGERGEGQQPGQQPGERQPGQGQQPGEQVADATQPGQQGQRGEQGQQPGQQGQGQQGQEGQQGQGGQQPGQSGQRGGQRGGQQVAQGGNRGGGNRGGIDLSQIFNGGVDAGGPGGISAWRATDWVGGPFTGNNFGPWLERLRNVEDLLDAPDLRNQVTTTIERARALRRDLQNDRTKPDWVKVQLQIVKPLVEVRARLAEEIARRDSKDSLAPIDRDPVPTRFAESVRRYYEELGKDKPDSK
ncbi:MAG: hypothetical protein HZA93_07090 [Verrucomicrobia bacterium]|nr:hypothetical protein [Verrucomicrobiota bacterium]